MKKFAFVVAFLTASALALFACSSPSGSASSTDKTSTADTDTTLNRDAGGWVDSQPPWVPDQPADAGAD